MGLYGLIFQIVDDIIDDIEYMLIWDGNDEVSVLENGAQICLYIDDGVEWDLGYPITYVSIGGPGQNKVTPSSYIDTQTVCFDVDQNFENNEYVPGRSITSEVILLDKTVMPLFFSTVIPG